MSRVNYAFAVGLIGLFLLLLGSGLAWFGTRSLIKMWAWERLTLKNASEAMTRWVHPPTPVIMKVYIFNVTNPEDVSEGALPNLSEVGPYVFEQFREKVNIIQLDNFTLSYQLRNTIKFKPSLSGGLRESDRVTILNVPLAGAILSVYETVPEFVGMLDDIWQLFYPGQKNIFITTSVRNILFDGITMDCTSKITEVYVACRGLESRKSPAVRKEGKNFKFSFFHAKNGTSRETYQIHQGVLDLRKTAQYAGVNYSPSIKTWRNHYCDMINGSEGGQFPVMVDKKQKLYVFEKDLCRSVYTEFEKEVRRRGVTLYKFATTLSLFASPENNPDNKCFCRSPLNLMDLVGNEEDHELEERTHNPNICFQNGILALMPCVGAPIVASFPHFYLGDQSYINYSGLNPSKKLHETFVYVEPVSGMAVIGCKRVQFNLELKRISDVQITSRLADGLFPILWVEEAFELAPEFFKLLRYSLIEKTVLEYGTFILIGVGALLIIASYLVQKILKRQTSQTKKLDGYPQPLRVWKRPNPSTVIPNDSVNLKQSQMKEFHQNFLIDNFM